MQNAAVNTDSLSTVELAERLNVSTSRIRQIALSLGLSRKGRDWRFSGPDIEKIAGHTRMREITTTTHPHWRKQDEKSNSNRD